MIERTAIRETRYSELGYAYVYQGNWQVIDVETCQQIGPKYKSKAELLADLSRFASEYGCDQNGR